MMEYQAALREWGARRLEGAARYHAPLVPGTIDRSTVRVRMDFDEGYACCGGSDPECYCSFAQSPVADVRVEGSAVTGELCSWSMPVSGFDFAAVLREIVDAGGGSLTS